MTTNKVNLFASLGIICGIICKTKRKGVYLFTRGKHVFTIIKHGNNTSRMCQNWPNSLHANTKITLHLKITSDKD